MEKVGSDSVRSSPLVQTLWGTGKQAHVRRVRRPRKKGEYCCFRVRVSSLVDGHD